MSTCPAKIAEIRITRHASIKRRPLSWSMISSARTAKNTLLMQAEVRSSTAHNFAFLISDFRFTFFILILKFAADYSAANFFDINKISFLSCDTARLYLLYSVRRSKLYH